MNEGRPGEVGLGRHVSVRHGMERLGVAGPGAAGMAGFVRDGQGLSRCGMARLGSLGMARSGGAVRPGGVGQGKGAAVSDRLGAVGTGWVRQAGPGRSSPVWVGRVPSRLGKAIKDFGPAVGRRAER